MAKQTYYQVMDYQDEDNPRLIYTFADEMAANDLVEFLHTHDPLPIDIQVDELEVETKAKYG